MPDDVWVQFGPTMFVECVIGGEHNWAMIVDHWAGLSWTQIEDKHGVPRSTARREVIRALMRMRRCGLNADAVRSYATASQSQTLTAP